MTTKIKLSKLEFFKALLFFHPSYSNKESKLRKDNPKDTIKEFSVVYRDKNILYFRK